MIPRLLQIAFVLSCACSAKPHQHGEAEPAASEVPTTKPAAARPTTAKVLPANARNGAMSMQTWHWHSSPVLEPGGELFVGFSASNAGPETIAAADFWGNSRLVLTGPDGGEQAITGDALIAIDSAVDLATGVSSTAVVSVETLFRFAHVGDYQLRWTSVLGELTFTLRVLPPLQYLLYRLANDQAHNQWQLHVYGEDGTLGPQSLAARLVSQGEAAVPGLITLLDDERPCLIEGSEDATIGSMYAHRRMDYAAILIAQIRKLDVPELRARTRDARAPGIAKIRRAITSSGPRP